MGVGMCVCVGMCAVGKVSQVPETREPGFKSQLHSFWQVT